MRLRGILLALTLGSRCAFADGAAGKCSAHIHVEGKSFSTIDEASAAIKVPKATLWLRAPAYGGGVRVERAREDAAAWCVEVPRGRVERVKYGEAEASPSAMAWPEVREAGKGQGSVDVLIPKGRYRYVLEYSPGGKEGTTYCRCASATFTVDQDTHLVVSNE